MELEKPLKNVCHRETFAESDAFDGPTYQTNLVGYFAY